jgi:hypothetical protein
MQNRLFQGVLSALVLISAGCASSAAESALPVQIDDEPVGAEGELDAGDPDEEEDPPVRDAAVPKDASRPGSGDASVTVPDASALDAGKDAAVGPAKDPDAGKPPLVDASQPPLTCSGGSTACNNQCVATSADEANCGGCGKVCAGGQTCTDSVCVAPVQVPDGCTQKTFASRSYLFCTRGRSWPDARNTCIDGGMDLAIVNDMSESGFVGGNGESWIGTGDRDREGAYRAVVPGNRERTDGANASFTRWAGGEPNNVERCDGLDIFVGCLGKRTDEDCIMVRADGQWVDELCDRSKNFVCEAY